MLNKKAIAAFAAGATLLSGLAFAVPAFADDAVAPQGAAAQGPKDPQAAPKDPQAAPKDPQAAPKDPQAAPKDPQAAPKDPQAAPAAPAEATYDKSFYKTETFEELDARLAKEKAEKEAKAKAEDENDKYEHSPFGNKDMDYKKCVKLYGKDDLACKAVADYLKRHGQKVDDKTAAKKSDKKAAAPLAKTGAAVALAAVAASVLAGMGVALRKIRH